MDLINLDDDDLPQIIQDEARAIDLLSTGLSKKHGEVKAMRESSGLQLYMACPDCLQLRGRVEMFDKKLAVNVERFLRLGKHKNLSLRHADYSGYCMREKKIFKVSELLKMVCIHQRGFPEARINVGGNLHTKLCVISDEKGNTIPDHPGVVVPMTQLPADHVAVQYLTSRGYDIGKLYEQFRISFCTQEAPTDWNKSRGYRLIYDDFKDTPQNRIIFYADMLGVQRGWQARVIEKVENGVKFYLHPYSNQWFPAECKTPEGKWEALPHIKEERGKFDVSKYKTGFSVSRNEILMGLDAALKWNLTERPGLPRVVLVSEGPLDAGRFGPPGIPLLGKFFSDLHFRMLTCNFDSIIYAGQNDDASRDLGQKIELTCQNRIVVSSIYPPSDVKDFGDMTYEAALAYAAPTLERHEWTPKLKHTRPLLT